MVVNHLISLSLYYVSTYADIFYTQMITLAGAAIVIAGVSRHNQIHVQPETMHSDKAFKVERRGRACARAGREGYFQFKRYSFFRIGWQAQSNVYASSSSVV